MSFPPSRLIVISNRLPIAAVRAEDGSWSLQAGSGGLVTALAPVLESRGGLWVGWPGLVGERHHHSHRSARLPCRDRPDRRRLLPPQGSPRGSREKSQGAHRTAAADRDPHSSTRTRTTSYVAAVLRLCCRLPDTPDRPRPLDRRLAAALEQRRVPLELVRAAFILATARRTFSASASLPLIRSLHYFLPILHELQQQPPDPGYLEYLRRRLRANSNSATSQQRLETAIFTE